jgi:putative pre-16S rRNA nuclease
LARFLAIDYGRKRAGLAVTDPLRIIANSLTTVMTQDLFPFLEKYFAGEPVDTIVVGYPRQMNNMPSEAVVYIDPFIKKLRKTWPDKKVVLMDERFTSKMAVQAMIDGGVKKMGRRNKELIDAISATIILQSYMDSIKNESLLK